MNKLRAILRKELLVLLRDPVGLAVIFLMPLAVLLVVTLVQDGAFKKVSTFGIKVALVDEDGSAVSQELVRDFSAAPGIQPVTGEAGKPADRESARNLVHTGRAQAIIVFPNGLGRSSLDAARQWAGASSTAQSKPPAATPPPMIETYFDPGTSAPYRMLVTLALERLAQGKEFELDMKAWGNALPEEIAKRLPPQLNAPRNLIDIPPPEFRSGHAIKVAAPANATAGNGTGSATLLPDMVQFNVPAYSVFAMFFIVIPISTCLLRERRDGTLTRLLTMPVQPLAIIAGKLLIFLGVSLLQFSLMMVAGRWLLPALGTQPFNLTASVPALVILTLCTGFAAVGFALMVASTATSQEQAGMLGATSVVILAALGGVMVPVFFMPPIMQSISSLTPLNWGVTAYQDLFTRNATLTDIPGRLLLLAGFGCAGTLVSWLRLFKKY